MITALTSFCQDKPAQAREALGVSLANDHLRAATANLAQEPTAAARAIYTGVLYDHLDLSNADASTRRRATRQVRVFSALFGVLTLADRVPAYRLNADSSLPGIGRVSSYWRPYLTEVLPTVFKRRLVIDMRSSSYVAMWKPSSELRDHVLTVKIWQRGPGGSRTAVSHFSKATKGEVARTLIELPDEPRSVDEVVAGCASAGWNVDVSDTSSGPRLDVLIDPSL